MLIKEEKKVAIKKEKDVVKQEKDVIKQEKNVKKQEKEVIIKQEKDRIKTEIKQEIEIKEEQDSFEVMSYVSFFYDYEKIESNSSTEESTNKKRKKSYNKKSLNKKPKSFWTPEEDQALFDAVTSFVNGKWKDVCSKHSSLAERGPRMVYQRWNTKSKYFLGNNVGK